MRSPFLICLFCSIACASPHAESRETASRITVADERAIRAVDSSYVAAWLRDDTAGVLATLAPDVVLMPAGQHPLATSGEVRGFWWPADGSHTKILTFDRHIDELAGEGDVAWTRGTDSLTFTYQKAGSAAAATGNRTMTLALLRRQPDGQWRISRMMWGMRTR
jgi:ketosteroid isomerase-like protein